MTERALIAGASIAGPALAYWLARYGWEVVVQERADALRTGGQNIDIRGAGRTVIERMGLDDAVRAATTGEEGTRFEDADGRVLAAFPVKPSSSGGATAEREILRGDLAQLLVDASVQAGVLHRYGDRIVGLEDGPDGVRVGYEHGEAEAYDLVVAADGVRSSTRDLVLGDEVRLRPLDLHLTVGTIERTPSDVDWWRWYNAPGGRSLTLRPDRHGTIRAGLTVQGRGEEEPELDAVFSDAGWQARRILDGFAGADDLYTDHVTQVHLPRWSVGRVGLVGDAAYCATPVSGMGTSLALVGAYVLAGELAAHVHHRDGFAGYERILRPYVDQAQDLPPGTPRLAHPRTAAGVAVMRTALRLAAGPAGRLIGGLFTPPADRIELPDYAHLLVR